MPKKYIAGEAQDIETIVRLRPWIEDEWASVHGSFSNTKLITDYNAETNIFNIQNAKHYNECIITEGSTDAMAIHQAGYPNVVATLGAMVSQHQFMMIRKYFDSVIIFSDNDEAGQQMRRDILEACSGKELYTVELPDSKKDAGEMTQEEITQTLNKKTIYI